jgi:hypothetical protein
LEKTHYVAANNDCARNPQQPGVGDFEKNKHEVAETEIKPSVQTIKPGFQNATGRKKVMNIVFRWGKHNRVAFGLSSFS